MTQAHPYSRANTRSPELRTLPDRGAGPLTKAAGRSFILITLGLAFSGCFHADRDGTSPVVMEEASCGSRFDDGGSLGNLSGCPSPLVLSSDLFIDADRGRDTPLCGEPLTPCHTVNYAMSLVRAQFSPTASRATVTLHARVDAGAGQVGNWTQDEHWPIRLDHGVILEAPDIDFPGVVDPSDVDAGLGVAIWVTDLEVDDGGDGQGAVIIRGSPGHPALVGYDFRPVSARIDGGKSPLPSLSTGLRIDSRTAILSNVSVGGSQVAISVGAGGTLGIGDGPVVAGWLAPNDGGPSVVSRDCAIECGALEGGPGISVSDQGATGAGQLLLPGGTGLCLNSGCTATLTHSPIFGIPPAHGECASHMTAAIVADPTGSIVLAGIVVQCAGTGILITAGNADFDAGSTLADLSISIDGGSFTAVDTVIYSLASQGSTNWALSNLQLGADPCSIGLEGGSPFAAPTGPLFANASLTNIRMRCSTSGLRLINTRFADDRPTGTLLLEHVDVSGLPDFGLVAVADTIEASDITVTDCASGMVARWSTEFSLDGGQLTCNSESNLRLSQPGASGSITRVSNVTWDHVPPTERIANCSPDGGLLADGGGCDDQAPADGVDIELFDFLGNLEVQQPQLLTGTCP